jgi:PEP-CTERM motif
MSGLTPAVYTAFFSPPATPTSGEWVYLLFDVDGMDSGVDPFAPLFAVNLQAPGDVQQNGAKDFGSPDLDAMGRISQVPEPGTLTLALIGLVAVLIIGVKRQVAAGCSRE